jgi:rod shape-determining protein MreB
VEQGLSRPHFGNRDLAVDLGTANTLVFERGRGIVVSEPSVIAVDADRGEVYAVGDEAHRMIGRTPATISATRPLRHGVIADFEVTEQMLRYFLRKAQWSRWSRPRVIMCVPSGVTDVEMRAVEEACLSAGARQVALIEEPIAAAIGAGLPIAEPTGHMVVDIGGGTSEVAVISMGEIVVETSLRLAGYDLDEAIMAYVRRHHNLAIGQPSAEEIKISVGSAFPLDPVLEVEVRGRELLSGLPTTLMLDSNDIRAALAEPVQSIVDAVRDTLDRTPPELASDILSSGLLLAGGGALLHGFAARLEQETDMPTRVADSALTCVALGAGQALEEFEAIARRQALHRNFARRPRPGARRPRAGRR